MRGVLVKAMWAALAGGFAVGLNGPALSADTPDPGASAGAATAPVNPAETTNPGDPTVSQVYDLARAGHLDQARGMMDTVIANHPHSARALYVAAELDADLKNTSRAQDELRRAEKMDPGLPFANPKEVAALHQQIGLPAPEAPATPPPGGAAAISDAAVPPDGPVSGAPAGAAAVEAPPPGAVAPAPATTMTADPAPAPAPAAPRPVSTAWGIGGVIAAVAIALALMLRRRQGAAASSSPDGGSAPAGASDVERS
jgi:hypothetical protein